MRESDRFVLLRRLTLLVTMLVGSAIPNGAHRLLRHDHHTSPLLLNPTVAFMQHITTSGYKVLSPRYHIASSQ